MQKKIKINFEDQNYVHFEVHFSSLSVHFYRSAIWVALVSRRGCKCGKRNFLEAKHLRFLRTSASAVLPVHAGLLKFIPHPSLCAVVFRCTKRLDMLGMFGSNYA